MKQFNPEDTLIFNCITGSQLYGLSTPTSDTDYRGICIPTMEVLLNPFTPFEQKDSGFGEEDRVVYSLGKFIKLCADSNPNIVELLFIPKDKVLVQTKEWDILLANKKYFLSKKAKYTFLGYAFAQLNSIKTHRQWFIDPPKDKPHRKDFGLSDSPIVSGDNLDSVLNIKSDLFKPEYQEEFSKEREYRLAKKKWDNYASWKDNRNPARREMEDKFGYDCKNSSHLLRLMSEGKELLLTGNITFPLPNADEIRQIKLGKYGYDELLSKVGALEKEFETWYNQSTLPNAPDRNALTELYLEIVEKVNKVDFYE